jgi:hypothetical protein
VYEIIENNVIGSECEAVLVTVTRTIFPERM